ncbi:MAG TPA: CHAD domain-containing protein [Dermatophilaceae bacterium]|nr:CHAD domain-containing protein [Dermatophilaceae bacterium]
MDTTLGTVCASFYAEPDLVLPDLPAGDGAVDISTSEYEVTYFDTANKDLRRLGLMLSRQHNGDLDRWRLESGDDVTEFGDGTGTDTVPEQVADLLLGVRWCQELTPVLTVTQTATVHKLHRAPGIPSLKLVDSRLNAVTMGLESTIAGWRTVEVTGDHSDGDAVTEVIDRLKESGATESTSSHLDTLLSLGAVDEKAPDQSQLGGLVEVYLGEQLDAIARGDLGLRTGQPVIHPTRVALRRFRSTLRVFRKLFDADQSRSLEEELRWIAGVLGEVRDAEILSSRLEEQLADLPAEHVLGPVASHIRGSLAEQRATGLAQLRDALADPRYAQLLSTLHEWSAGPPFTDLAAGPASEASRYVKRARRKFRQRLHSALEDPPATLHSARKAAKRLRYAAELAVPALGAKAEKTAEQAKKLQTLLGEHQDASVSADFLRRVGAQTAGESGHNGYTYGLLVAQEWSRAERIQRKLAKRLGR